MRKLLAITTWVLVLTARGAMADSRAMELFEEGQRLYHAGQYVEAGERFAAAYKLEADPAYIYNAAQAYRSGNACARAAAAYRTFQTAVPNAPEPEKLRGHIEEMDACAAKQRLAPPPPDLDIAPRDPPPPRVDAQPAPPRDVEPTTDAGRTKRMLGIGIGAAGVALVGTAIYFSFEARSITRDYEEHCDGATMMQPCDGAVLADLDERGRRAERLQIVSFIAGGAALAGGVTLYLLGRKQQRESALALQPTRGGAMVTSGWRF